MKSIAASPAERTRLEEVDRHCALGPAGLPALLAMLTDKSWIVRRAVVAALASLGDVAARAVAELVATQRDDEARIAAAVDALAASIGDVDPLLLELSRHASAAVVADAAQVMGRRRGPAAVKRLAELLEHPDDNVAVSAIEALGRIGGRAAIDALVGTVESGNFFRVFPAIDVLGRSGDPRAVAPLAALLAAPQYSPEAARALGRTGDRSAVAHLAGLLGGTSLALTRVAAEAIADLVDRHAERTAQPEPIVELIRARAPKTAVRRLATAVEGAGPREQAAISRVLAMLGGGDAAEALSSLLDTPDSVSTAAADALMALGSDAEAHLSNALRKGDADRRRLLLGRVRHPSAADAAATCLSDSDVEVRALACEALGRLGHVPSLPLLFERLDDTNPRVLHAAVSAIQSIGGRRVETLAMAAASSGSRVRRAAALRILAYFAFPAALPLLLAALDDPDARIQEAAVAGLPLFEDSEALEALLTRARDERPRTRGLVMRALGAGPGGERSASALLRGLADPDAWVRYHACKGLGQQGDLRTAASVAERLHDDAGQVRVAAVEALAMLGGDAALGALEQAARSADPDLRRAGLIGLGLRKSDRFVDTLVSAMSDPDAATRLVAASAVAGVEAEHVVPALVRAASDSDETVRAAAVGFLAARAERSATRALVELLRVHPDRSRVLDALALPAPGRTSGLLEMLAVADDDGALDLTGALARMHTPEAEQALLGAMSLPSAAARKAAATTLAAVGGRESLAALQKASQSDPDPEVRRVCQLLLAS